RYRDFRSTIDRKMVGAGADRRKSDRLDAVFDCQLKAGKVGLMQELFFICFSALPDWSDRMDDVLSRKLIATAQLCLTGRAASQRAAFLQKLRTGSTMDGAIHASSAEQRIVGGVDNRLCGNGCKITCYNFKTIHKKIPSEIVYVLYPCIIIDVFAAFCNLMYREHCIFTMDKTAKIDPYSEMKR